MAEIRSNDMGFRVFKFENRGDELEAVLKEVETREWTDNTGKTKEIKNIVFDEAGETVKVPAYTNLENIIKQNPDLIGRRIKVKYEADKKVNQLNPMKVFVIDDLE